MAHVLLLAGLVFSLGAQGASSHPTFVLVHGALFTSAGWMKAQGRLQSDGYNVVTLDVPGRAGDGVDPATIDVKSAAEKVCQVVGLQNGPVILVGHSQGGALITQSLDRCASQIKALVYVAAVVPLNGEIAFQMLDPKVDVNFMKCATPDPTAGLFRLNPSGPLASSFFQDLAAGEVPAVVASMVSEPIGIGTTPLSYPTDKFDGTPKFFLETLQDQVLTLGTQRRIQARMTWTGIRSMDTGHSPFLTRPEQFVRILKDIEASL